MGWERLNRMNGGKRHEPRQATRQAIFGGVLFVVCVVFFMAADWKGREFLAFQGSVIFVPACMVFLVPRVRSAAKTENDTR